MSEKKNYSNRLIHEKSPYLLQHAHNPVDWYPWGEEAFTAAQSTDKPIFLSIGYSTCHWCHVMERESFENPEIARLMNNTFICIKIDREELPEVDHIYMEMAQSMISGAVGWPLNLVLTPDLQPFFAATYLPPKGRPGMIGMQEMTLRIADIWQGGEREKALEQADGLVEIFQENIHTEGEKIPDASLLEDACDMLLKMADPIYGGISGAPKFPLGFQQSLLMRLSLRTKDSRPLFLVDRTLDMMSRGGIYDHLGGGFSRYSVDEKWFVPHFEKMLYDNAMLIMAYTEGWLVLHREEYRQVVVRTIHYILREMTGKFGGFFSAEDADSEGKEGRFYTWTFQEINHLLRTHIDKDLFIEFFAVTEGGNFEEGRNVLHTPLRVEEFAKAKGIPDVPFRLAVEDYARVLFLAREERERPFKDDKVLTAWNGLMIAALVFAGLSFNDMRFVEAGFNAATFIREQLYKEGNLLRRWRDGEALYNGGLDDYSSMVRAALYLFEAGLGASWLQWAVELAERIEVLFKSPKGAYFMTASDTPHLILRKCHFSDGAEPSGNALHCENLIRLYRITGEEKYKESADDILRAVDAYLEQYPPGYCYHLMNLDRYYYVQEAVIVVSLNATCDKMEEIRDLLFKKFIPYKTVVWKRKEEETLLAKLAPAVASYAPIDGKSTLYICHHGVCRKPINDFEEMKRAINEL